MTVTYGFYDSLGGDRVYNALQMSRLFEGMIVDGVFESIGTKFAVAPSSGMILSVGAGRAWFNYTWTLNDAPITVTVLTAEVALNRIDTVVLEVNTDVGTRANTIKIIKGTPAGSPVAPTLASTSTLHQYALADIYVGAGVTTITGGNITNKVGTVGTPYVTGIVTNAILDALDARLDILEAAGSSSGGDVIRTKYIIALSVAGGNLTVALKYINGTDPSVSQKLTFRVGDTEYVLQAAMSFTKNAATNWANLGSAEMAALPHDLFLYAIGETGGSAGLKFGWSRISWAKTMGDFVNTNTNELYIAGNWTNFNSADFVTPIGRFRVQLSAGGAYTWSNPSPSVINRPIFEGDWLNWTPVFGGFSANPTSVYARYKIIHGAVRWIHRANADGTSNATTFTFTLPFTPKNNTNANSQVVVNAIDNGVSLAGAARCAFNNGSGNVATVFKDMAAGAWTASGGKRIGGMQITDMEV